MDVANQTGGLVIGTGDLSELALGWATYNGDQMSMYGVNASVPKTLVKHLVKWVAAQEEESVRKLLLDVANTPISPELLPADSAGKISQKTEDLVGPYELHDFYLYHFFGAGLARLKFIFWPAMRFGGSMRRRLLKNGWSLLSGAFLPSSLSAPVCRTARKWARYPFPRAGIGVCPVMRAAKYGCKRQKTYNTPKAAASGAGLGASLPALLLLRAPGCGGTDDFGV